MTHVIRKYATTTVVALSLLAARDFAHAAGPEDDSPAPTETTTEAPAEPVAPQWGEAAKPTFGSEVANAAGTISVPDVTLTALVGQELLTTTVHGVVAARLVGFSASSVTLSAAGGNVVVVPRTEVRAVRVAATALQDKAKSLPGAKMEVAGAILTPMGVAGLVGAAVMSPTDGPYDVLALAAGGVLLAAGAPLLTIGIIRRRRALDARKGARARVSATPIRTRRGGWGGGVVMQF